MFKWLSRLFFRRKKPVEDPSVQIPTPAELGVVPQGYTEDSEAKIRTAFVGTQGRAHRVQEVEDIVSLNPELTFSQAHAVVTQKSEGPRAEIVIQPKDGMGLPILPADLAPETTAIPSISSDLEVTRRLPPLSERNLAKERKYNPVED